MKPSTKTNVKTKLIYFFSVILFVILWEVLSLITGTEIILPSPVKVLKEIFLCMKTEKFLVSLCGSFCRVLAAFVFSFIPGLILGFASGLSKNVRTFISFPSSVLKSVPVVALIMVMLFWFDSKILPVISAVIMTLPMFTDALSLAVESTDRKLLDMARVYKLGKWKTITSVYYPEVKPVIAGTSRTVFSFCWKIVAAGEILSMPHNGLGTLIQENRILMEASRVFAVVILLSLISIVSGKIFGLLFRYFSVLANKAAQKKAEKCFNICSENTDFSISGNDIPLKVENLSFSYGEKELLKNLNVKLQKGSVTCLFAPTGKGKTTFLNIISGLIPEDSFTGKISSDAVSYIFQEPRLCSGLSVLQNVLLGAPGKKTENTGKAFSLLKGCGLEDKVFFSPDSLSGGEKQKVQICRAFMNDAPLILMDEGTSSLDETSRNEMWTLIERFVKEKKRTLLFVTHDGTEARVHSTEIICF